MRRWIRPDSTLQKLRGNVGAENRVIMNRNNEQCYSNISKQGRLIIDLINSFE